MQMHFSMVSAAFSQDFEVVAGQPTLILARASRYPMVMQRLRIWPGVDTSMLVAVLKAWLAKHRVSCITTCFRDLLPSYFGLAPRLECLAKLADLALEFVKLAKNGVLSNVCTRRAVEEVFIALIQNLSLNPKPSMGKSLKLARMPNVATFKPKNFKMNSKCFLWTCSGFKNMGVFQFIFFWFFV